MSTLLSQVRPLPGPLARSPGSLGNGIKPSFLTLATLLMFLTWPYAECFVM